jgi:RND family efflux transporter MFP subunit
MKSTHFSVGFGLVFAALLLVSCGRGGKEGQLARLRAQRDRITGQIQKLEGETARGADAGTASDKALAVSVDVVKPRRFDHYVEVQGKLDGDESVALYPRVGGVVVAKFAGPGDVVARSQVLAQLDDAALRDQIQAARAQAELARETHDRKQALSEQKIYSEIDYLADKTQLDVAEKTLAALLEQADMYRIRSPVDGTVAEADFKVGQTLSPAQPAPAYRIVNFSKLKVVAEVSDAYAARVKKGDEVSVYFPDLDREVNTSVSFASDYIDPLNRTFTVEVPVPDSKRGLKVNMLAVLRINDYRAVDAVAVSINSVLVDQTGRYVFVVEGSDGALTARRRYVTLGHVYGGIAEIREGLREGDRVITVGVQNVEDGNAVTY